jgi:hypothetical protein
MVHGRWLVMVYSPSMLQRAVLLTAIVMCPAGEVIAQNSPPHAVLFDYYMSSKAGAEDLLTIQHVLATAEDRWLPKKIGEEENRPGLALGILYRTGKFIALDVPQDHLLMVAAHEVFGHGARFRELGDGRVGYGFDVPIPYGSGDAFTRFEGRFPISPLASLNVSVAGIEAQHSLADAIAERAVARGRLHYREGWLYFESRITGMTYILSASPHSARGHDVADFLERFMDACTDPCSPLTRKYVQQRALLALADPMLFYAMYAVGGSYIGNGETAGPMPMIPVWRSVQLLPSLGYALAPYGAEWITRVALRSEQRAKNRTPMITNVTWRIGNTGASTTWAVGARARDVLRLKGLLIGVTVDIWRQPVVLARKTSDPLELGAGATATVVLPLPRRLRAPWVGGLIVTGGYKSEGYIPGEQLSGGGYLRAGIQID